MACSWSEAFEEAEEAGTDVLDAYNARLQADWGISLDEVEQVVVPSWGT